MKSDPELLISIVSRRGNVSICRLNVQICYRVQKVVVCGFCLELSHGKVMYVFTALHGMAISPNLELFWPQQQHILPTDAGKIFLPPSSFQKLSNHDISILQINQRINWRSPNQENLLFSPFLISDREREHIFCCCKEHLW